ncbi:pinin-like [Perognathus longimembris pacificus]|uniref:pinin-like n=1 Tax=Perognathus longimembris pacificus TaxID=214514 RepID=UPI0020183FCF|nr:pinin-like [Perognathus longimembris pacificus]
MLQGEDGGRSENFAGTRESHQESGDPEGDDKFKQESTVATERQKRCQEIEQKLEVHAEEERKQVENERRELFEERHAKRTELRLSEQKVTLPQLQEWDEHNAKIIKYIRTKTKPHLFYIPRRMCPASQKLIEES